MVGPRAVTTPEAWACRCGRTSTISPPTASEMKIGPMVISGCQDCGGHARASRSAPLPSRESLASHLPQATDSTIFRSAMWEYQWSSSATSSTGPRSWAVDQLAVFQCEWIEFDSARIRFLAGLGGRWKARPPTRPECSAPKDVTIIEGTNSQEAHSQGVTHPGNAACSPIRPMPPR